MPVEAGTTAAAATGPTAEAAAANGAVSDAVQQLLADVCALLPSLDEAAAGALHASLSALTSICSTLANPLTPLPEPLRAHATRTLKQALRRELIDEA